MDLSHANNKWLVLGMLRSSEVMGMIVQRLKLEDFRDNETPLRVAFIIGSRWHATSKTPVPYEVAVSAFMDELVPNRVLNDAEALHFGDILHWAYNSVAEFDEHKAYVLEFLHKFLIDRKVRPAAFGIDRAEDIVDKVQELTRTIASTSISRAKFIDPFMSATPMLSNAVRRPWGVDWVDIVTSGGATTGETTLFLAPSGGGKTLTNIQLATTAALNGEDSLILTYEQNAEGITNRIYAFAMGIPISSFVGLSKEGFEANKGLKAKYDKVRERLAGRLMIVDMLEAAQNNGGGGGGANEVELIVKQARDSGKEPRYVGIDWLGPMANNYMAVRGINTSEQTKIMNQMADDLRKVGSNLKVNIFVYHQLGTTASASGPQRKPEATDAYMCRTLHHYMDTVICVGNRDKESNMAWVNAPKVRNGAPFMDSLIQMDGALSRWKLVDKSEVNTETMKLYNQKSGAQSEEEDAPSTGKRRRDPLAFNETVRSHLG
jgi:hypothetical protein